MTVFSIIKTFFTKETSPPHFLAKPARAKPMGARVAPPGPIRPPAPDDDRLEDLISRQGETSQSVVAGSFELVGLDEIKEALGARWPDLAARASDLAEQGIRRWKPHGPVISSSRLVLRERQVFRRSPRLVARHQTSALPGLTIHSSRSLTPPSITARWRKTAWPAQPLQVSAGTHALELRRCYRDAEGQNRIITVSTMPAEHYTYEITLRRQG